MKRRFAVAPEAARDLARIWRYLKKESSRETADRVESVIRGKFPPACHSERSEESLFAFISK
jgi:plasmid stabilization system protein ParE